MSPDRIQQGNCWISTPGNLVRYEFSFCEDRYNFVGAQWTMKIRLCDHDTASGFSTGLIKDP